MSSSTYESRLIDDRRARRNTVLLSAAHALYGMTAVVIITTGGLIGSTFAEDKGLATLPVSAFVTGTAICTVPASLFMRWVGRRVGFMFGTGFGLSGSLLCLHSIYEQSFWLFVLGTFLMGGYQAFAQYYRFAAADVASERFKAKAISWVLIGGLFAAVFGPLAIIWSKDLFNPVLFAGCYVVSAAFAFLAMLILLFIDIPRPTEEQKGSSDARPLGEILKQPRLLIAIFCGMAAYGTMSLVMTASPLAMVACGFTVTDASWVIQWHVLAMYIPSFFAGHLINVFGKERVIAAGMLLLSVCGFVALSGIEFAHFGIALVFLGLGWNLGFVGATTLVTDCYRPSERNKVQAVNDLCVFSTVACASFTSGQLLDRIGWDAVNITLFPVVALALMLLTGLFLLRRRVQAVGTGS